MDQVGPLEEHQIPVCTLHSAAWSRTCSLLGVGQQVLPVSPVLPLEQVSRHSPLYLRRDSIPPGCRSYTEKVFSLVSLSLSQAFSNQVLCSTPPSPCMILCIMHMSAWCRLSSRVYNPSSFRRSSYPLWARPDTMPTAFLWTFSRTFLSPSDQGAQAGVLNSRWGLTYCTYSLTNTCRSL